jgi:hypothetical protein
MNESKPDVPQGRQSAPAKLPVEMTWSVSPWATNWKRPAAAMAICFAIALLAGFSFNYPNYPATLSAQSGTPADGTTAEQTAETGADAAADAPLRWIGQAITWSLISLALLLAMTAAIYLPVRYKLDAQGVTAYFLGVPNHRPWRHYRNFYVHKMGVHVTTMPTPSALDPFRGHFLQFSANRDEVVAFIEAHMTLRGVPEGKEPDGEGK